ncbi:hypothetical protein OG453_29890 [Streptomyces sp. NBC_01381]|uniref:hypothetical protein n=1 Tax=Streptomyces sp. NBC_01381 TaxID=2903845 RepID=UPI002256A7DE|nr:hypothetical protein [Streptomyces sp. NBC_01381]MCX4670858.1 hypothetical protein [Streptomyces sp. NBC_01381]
MPKLRDVRRRTWLLVAGVTVLAVAVAGTGIAVSRSMEHSEQLAADKEQLADACAGLLPEGVGYLLPDDTAGELREYGTMLRPGQQSRALLDCTVRWGEDEAQVRVRAEAVLGQAAAPGGGFAVPLPSSALGGAGGTDGIGPQQVSATLLASCPKGLTGRVRPSEDLLVSVDLPSSADNSYDVPKSERLDASRTAVRAADWVSRKQGCGGQSLNVRKAADGSALCHWLSPKALKFSPGRWRFDGNDKTYSERAGSCGGEWDDTAGWAEERKVKAASAESWSGILAAGAYESHAGSGYVPGSSQSTHKPDSEGQLRIEESGDDPQFALWARSACEAGPTYHRVTVVPAFDFQHQDAVVLDKQDRRRFSAQARAVLDRYLAAADGWPRRSHCRNTEIMGEVEEWQG